MTPGGANVTADVSSLPIAIFNDDLAGKLDGKLALSGQGKVLTGEMDATLSGVRARGSGKTLTLDRHPLIELRRQEVTQIPSSGIVVLTTGPLTSTALAADLQDFTGEAYMSFFDAASPIVVGDSIDRTVAFMASRYDRGEAAYLNCPMDRQQYQQFHTALCQAEQAELKE
ncbi:MAG: methylenetetrahydrofolate--tRNA-(uracil(54)-C(5))-methyltransferase (FADH(2)-oxidizing) TrmFO, partial [Caulobacteraceae bacterium]|nr:methylenetetrahydrofolate--tRNA-(uracil(54)-C(5))-methyltransferase (FADH(2)-oxidizing) TrmFO [Caulobacteraceae bacterium]